MRLLLADEPFKYLGFSKLCKVFLSPSHIQNICTSPKSARNRSTTLILRPALVVTKRGTRQNEEAYHRLLMRCIALFYRYCNGFVVTRLRILRLKHESFHTIHASCGEHIDCCSYNLFQGKLIPQSQNRQAADLFSVSYNIRRFKTTDRKQRLPLSSYPQFLFSQLYSLLRRNRRDIQRCFLYIWNQTDGMFHFGHIECLSALLSGVGQVAKKRSACTRNVFFKACFSRPLIEITFLYFVTAD